MLTKEEIDKLFYNNFHTFMVHDPMPPSCWAIYDCDPTCHYIVANKDLEGKNKFIIGQSKSYIRIPLINYETIKHFTNTFINAINQAIKITNNVHELDRFNIGYIQSIFNKQDLGYCHSILGLDTYTNRNYRNTVEYKEIHSGIIMKLYEKIDIPENMYFCFPQPEFVGVIPQSTENELGLAIMAAENIHAIRIVK